MASVGLFFKKILFKPLFKSSTFLKGGMSHHLDLRLFEASNDRILDGLDHAPFEF